MKNIAYISICSLEYINYYKELYKSLEEHSPNSIRILYYIGKEEDLQNIFYLNNEVINITDLFNECSSSYNTLEKICSLRARVVLDTFDRGYGQVVFCGAKLKFFSYPGELEVALQYHDAVVTPHITQPLPEDSKFPSNASVSFTGHISTDLVGFKNTPKVVEFLQWQDEIMKTQCKTTQQTYLDQSWLNFLPFFVRNVKILHNQAYNVAYWNYKQRYLRISDYSVALVDDDGVGKPMVCFQFSGLDLNNPAGISIHQNREVAEGKFLEFLTDYANKVKS